MKDIKAIKGKFYLQKLIAEGEHEHQDFKFQISDARKIARSISAFANNSGGHLLIGVKDNGVIAGVRNEEDIFVVEQAAQLYCRPEQTPIFTAYKADEGAVVIKAEIKASAKRPVLASEPDGSWHAYYRVADENISAHPLMVKSWQRKASETGGLFNFSEAEKTLLNALADDRGVRPESIPQLCMVSRAVANDMVTRLFAMSLIEFRFQDRHFVITATEPTD